MLKIPFEKIDWFSANYSNELMYKLLYYYLKAVKYNPIMWELEALEPCCCFYYSTYQYYGFIIQLISTMVWTGPMRLFCRGPLDFTYIIVFPNFKFVITLQLICYSWIVNTGGLAEIAALCIWYIFAPNLDPHPWRGNPLYEVPLFTSTHNTGLWTHEWNYLFPHYSSICLVLRVRGQNSCLSSLQIHSWRPRQLSHWGL